MLVTFLLVGVMNIRYELDTIRIVGESSGIQTVVIGNSHSNALRYPDSLNSYYLNESGALLSHKLLQSKNAANLFSDLQLVISDISPAEFYACGDRNDYRNFNVLRLGNFRLDQAVPDVLTIINLLVLDPRKLLNEPPPRPNPQNGKVLTRETAVEDFGATRHLLTCNDTKNVSMIEASNSLEKLVVFIMKKNLGAIFVVPPHTKDYRDEMAENTRGNIATKSMYETMNRLETDYDKLCVIDLYDLKLDIDNFLDGDHLSRLGEESVAPILEKSVTDCLNEIGRDSLIP